MGNRILFVDDERAILNTVLRTLRGSGLEIFVAEDGPAALAILAVQEIDIIISDMRMPKMSGHQLLRRVRELCPSTTRVLLSGHAEEAEIAKALLDGSCKMYVLKPWDVQALLTTIRQLQAVRVILRDKKLLELINKIGEMCSLPRIFIKLKEMIDKDAAIEQIAAVLEQDPVMAARILHMVNSAFYGVRTGSVSQAITYLGLEAVKNIVLSASMCELLTDQSAGMLNKDLLVRHASLTNRLVGELHRRLTGKHIAPTASSVGLLHDIGRMALVHQMPEKYVEIAAALKQCPDVSFDELEQKVVGVSHQEVGAYLLDWWDLPQHIMECAMFHHDPFHESVGNRELVSIVHIASYFAQRTLAPAIAGTLEPRTLELLNISREDCESLLGKER